MSDFVTRIRKLGLSLVWRMDAALPGIAIPFANAVIQRQYEERRSSRSDDVTNLTSLLDGWAAFIDHAQAAYKEEIARREGIERKAVALVSATGVSSGLITAAGVIGILVPQELTVEGKIAVGSALLVPLVCFVIGFILALSSWRVGAVELVGPSTLRALSSHPNATRSSRLAAERLVAAELNQLLTLKRVNYLSGAENWIMRGTGLIAAAALTLLILAATTDLLTPVSPL